MKTRDLDSIQLYKQLLENSEKRLIEFTKNFPRQERQFTFVKFNEIAFQKMYEDLKDVIPRQQFFSDVPDLKEVCKGCWGFYLKPRNKSLKFLDIRLGKLFEDILRDFFISIGLQCVRFDDMGFRKNYPDLIIIDNEKPIAFLEIKYLTAPFVMIFRKVPGRECYEGSTTLDADKKLEAQRDIVENDIKVPVYYVYWLDYPCIKGIFFMPSEEVFSYVDETKLEWTRKEREGNFVHAKGKRIRLGHTEKIYLPLLKMGNFEELVQTIQKLIEKPNEDNLNKKNGI